MSKIILFASGSGSNAENVINYFKNNPDVTISHILCNNKNAYVFERAKKLQVPAMLISRQEFSESDHVLRFLLKEQPDLIVLAGFLWLVPTHIIQAFPNQIINIHPALLPKYGGKGMYGHHVHQAVVDNHETQSGITIHYVNEKYDEGNIIFQATCPIMPSDSPSDVAAKVHELEYLHFPNIIHQLLPHSS